MALKLEEKIWRGRKVSAMSVKVCKAAVKPFICSFSPLSCLLVPYCEQQSFSDLGAIRASSNLERVGLQAAVL